MPKAKRPKLSPNEQFCLLVIGDHCVTDASAEFSRKDARTVRALQRKKLVHRSDDRWVVTGEGYAEWKLLVVNQIIDAARQLGQVRRAGAPTSRPRKVASEGKAAAEAPAAGKHPSRRVPA